MKPGFYRKLSPEEEKSFRQWARENYTPGDPISDLWHPASRAECELMNLEVNREIGAEQ
jgi:hypothetical protein